MNKYTKEEIFTGKLVALLSSIENSFADGFPEDAHYFSSLAGIIMNEYYKKFNGEPYFEGDFHEFIIAEIEKKMAREEQISKNKPKLEIVE
jgi:hypothetical protein